jgi:hypothetical protein
MPNAECRQLAANGLHALKGIYLGQFEGKRLLAS